MRCHTTEITCPECNDPVKWCKFEFLRDGHFDWRLDVFCLCGEVTDPAILERVHDIHERQVAEAIHETQEATLKRQIGRLNELLDERLAGNTIGKIHKLKCWPDSFNEQ